VLARLYTGVVFEACRRVELAHAGGSSFPGSDVGEAALSTLASAGVTMAAAPTIAAGTAALAGSTVAGTTVMAAGLATLGLDRCGSPQCRSDRRAALQGFVLQ
jgi:hypothetical protein